MVSFRCCPRDVDYAFLIPALDCFVPTCFFFVGLFVPFLPYFPFFYFPPGFSHPPPLTTLVYYPTTKLYGFVSLSSRPSKVGLVLSCPLSFLRLTPRLSTPFLPFHVQGRPPHTQTRPFRPLSLPGLIQCLVLSRLPLIYRCGVASFSPQFVYYSFL